MRNVRNRHTIVTPNTNTNTRWIESANAWRTSSCVSGGNDFAVWGESSAPGLMWLPGNRSSMRLVSEPSAIAAAMATPSAPPSCRVKFTNALAMPMRGRSTAFCAASAVVMKLKPMPTPRNTMAIDTWVFDESAPTCVSSAPPQTRLTMPAPVIRR